MLCKLGEDEKTTTIQPFLSPNRAKTTTEVLTTTTFKPLIRVKSKKAEKPTTTTTTTTRRPTTTRRTTTTTEAPEVEYEYEDEYPTSAEKLEEEPRSEQELQHLLQLIADLGQSIIALFFLFFL